MCVAVSMVHTSRGSDFHSACDKQDTRNPNNRRGEQARRPAATQFLCHPFKIHLAMQSYVRTMKRTAGRARSGRQSCILETCTKSHVARAEPGAVQKRTSSQGTQLMSKVCRTRQLTLRKQSSPRMRYRASAGQAAKQTRDRQQLNFYVTPQKHLACADLCTFVIRTALRPQS